MIVLSKEQKCEKIHKMGEMMRKYAVNPVGLT